MSSEAGAKRKKRSYKQRPFPRHALEEALKVAKAIQDKNAGKPWKPLFVAEALKIKLGSSNFREIAGSSHKYGLTSGSWSSDTISLTSLGAALTKPVDSKLEIKSRQEAVLKIDPFKRIFEHYRDSKFPSPEDKYFKNMLESEFGIPREHIDECVELLVENGKFADIIRESQGALYVVFAEEPLEAPPEVPKGEVVEGEIPPTEAEIPSVPKPTPTPPVINQIFVAHGKNTVPLEQLKKILNEFQVPFKVAIDEPHVGRPISQKVAELMRSCTSAIIIFTADEESTDQEGNKTYRPSDNVVYELGAASVLYGDKIVILKEEGVTLASDFNDLGYIPFEKDKIKAKAMDLIKELIGFGLLKVTPA